MKRARKLKIKEVHPRYAAELRQLEDQLESDSLPPVDPNFEIGGESDTEGIPPFECQCCGQCGQETNPIPPPQRESLLGFQNFPVQVYDSIDPMISDHQLLVDMLNRHEDEVNEIEDAIAQAEDLIKGALGRRLQLMPRIASIKSSLSQF